MLAAFLDRYPRLAVLTQNVDGLHQKAGSDHLLDVKMEAPCEDALPRLLASSLAAC